jgi:hypothetical protein
MLYEIVWDLSQAPEWWGYGLLAGGLAAGGLVWTKGSRPR